MKDNYLKEFEQFYRMFSEIVRAFSDEAWEKVGHKKTVPQKLSFHILQSTKYYMNDASSFVDCAGHAGLPHDHTVADDFKISKEEILANIRKQSADIRKWVEEIDIEKKNEQFQWTGKDMDSVVIFVARHSYYHLGELNCLLNEYLRGDGDDFFAHNIW